MSYVFDIEDPVVYVCSAGWFNSRNDVQQIEGIVPLRVSDRHVDDFRQGLLANATTTGRVNQGWSKAQIVGSPFTVSKDGANYDDQGSCQLFLTVSLVLRA